MESGEIVDLHDWLDHRISFLCDLFDFSLCFDWVVIHSKKTKEPVSRFTILQSIVGKLNFDPPKVKEIETRIEEVTADVINLKNETIALLKKQIETRKRISELDAAKIKRLESQIATPAKKENRSCWIDKHGNTHYVGFAKHEEFASDWFEENEPEKFTREERDGRYFYEMLEEKGWIKVVGWSNPVCFVITKNPTVKQKQALREYCMSEEIPYKDYPEILKS